MLATFYSAWVGTVAAPRRAVVFSQPLSLRIVFSWRQREKPELSAHCQTLRGRQSSSEGRGEQKVTLTRVDTNSRVLLRNPPLVFWLIKIIYSKYQNG